MGKTELLRRHFEDRRHLYCVGDLTNAQLQVQSISQRLGALWRDPFLAEGRFSSWSDLLAYPPLQTSPLDLVLDEFPYLCEAEPALPSLIQKQWDLHWSRADVRLALCGSSISFMENEVLSEKSPMFGRRTAQMRLRPLTAWDCKAFLPNYSAADRVRAFACFGGVPAYLSKMDPSQTLEDNLCNLILDPVAYLYEEPLLLLHQELREPRTYFSVLRALAAGLTRLNDIAQRIGVDGHKLSRYLETLIRLELVERIVPATDESEHSRRGLYRIRDPFLRFWFAFVQDNRSEIDAGAGRALLENLIRPRLPHFCSQTFEDLCAEWVRKNTFRCKKVGRWWDRAHELDVLAYNDEEVLFGECKWSTSKVGPAALAQLQQASAAVPGFERHRRHYALFSLSGFEGIPSNVLQIDIDVLMDGGSMLVQQP